MEGIQSIDANGFETLIRTGVTLVDFGAPWCAPCRMQRPAIEKLAEQHNGKVLFAEVNVDENYQLSTRLSIMSIPTIIIFKNGREIKRFVGLQSAKALRAAIEKVMKKAEVQDSV